MSPQWIGGLIIWSWAYPCPARCPLAWLTAKRRLQLANRNLDEAGADRLAGRFDYPRLGERSEHATIFGMVFHANLVLAQRHIGQINCRGGDWPLFIDQLQGHATILVVAFLDGAVEILQ